MFLQELAKDAERILGGELPPPMYDRKPVRWIVELDAEGSYLGMVPQTGEGKGKDKGKVMLVPYVKRTSGVRPILFSDTPAYTFGWGDEDSRREAKHVAYVDLVKRCFLETGNALVKAVVLFLQGHEIESLELPTDLGAGDLISIRVAGTSLVDEEDVRNFWAQEASGASAAGEAEVGRTCVVCGKRRSIGEKPPVPVKRIPGAQAEYSLIGVNLRSGESYGMSRAENSGVCDECGERFGKALNKLLADDRGHLRVGPVVYVFWARENTDFDFVGMLSRPEPEDVQQMLSSYRRGKKFLLEERDAFFGAALSANGARVVVRQWISATIDAAQRSLGRWFTLTDIVDSRGKPGKPLGVYALAAGMYLRPDKQMVARVPTVLVDCALDGGRLPKDLLPPLLYRSRIAGRNNGSTSERVTHQQAALIKAILMSWHEGEEERMSQLENDETEPAYLCGRLFAVLESVQYEALGRVNATVADKFFAAASTAPATVFGKLMADAQPHLAKLRKTRPWVYEALGQRIEEVAAGLEGFPKTLTVEQQALFMLGYYHQRAADRASRKANSAGAAETEED